MANEIKLTVIGQLTHSGVIQNFEPGRKNIDQTTPAYVAGVYEVGTTEELIPTGDVSTLGMCFMMNTDPTGGNFVLWGPNASGTDPGTGVYTGKLMPQEPEKFRMLPNTQHYWKADTAPVKVQLLILED